MPFTNEPQGATLISDHNFTTIAGGSPTAWRPAYPQNGSIIDDAGDLESPPKVYRITWNHSTTGDSAVPTLNFPNRDEIFVGFTWKPSNPFTGWANLHNKIIFLWTTTAIIYMSMQGPQGGPFSFWWCVELPGVANSHLPGWGDQVGSWNLAPQQNGSISLGTWHRVEVYTKKSTTATSRNGILRYWLDGKQVGNYTTLNQPNPWNQVQFAQPWDQPEPNFPSAFDEHRYGHVRVSTGGTGGGGGTTPPAVLQSLTPVSASITTSQTQQYVVTMSAPVPTAVSMFTQSSNLLVATTPDFVTVNAGQSTGLFTATPVAAGSTTISTSYNGVNRSASLQVQANPGGGGGGGGNTSYDYGAQFSGTQGQDQWYYLEEDGTQMTYDSGNSIWRGTNPSTIQGIWSQGFHPGHTEGSKLRWVAPGDGKVNVTGSAADADSGGGVGATFRVQHNGVTLFTRVITNGQTTGGAYDLTFDVQENDTVEFLVTNTTADYTFNSTTLNPVIDFEADAGGGGEDPDPPPPPPPPVSVVDFFANTTAVVKNSPFTMTVRVSRDVDDDTTVAIQVGSTSLLTAPAFVVVEEDESEATFSVTPIAVGLVAIDAILNGTKRVNLSIRPDPNEEPTEPEEPPATAVLYIDQLQVDPDGARLVMVGTAKALQVKYDAKPTFTVVEPFPVGAADFRHAFIWPAGTTQVCYRLQGMDDVFSDIKCALLDSPPIPPPPPPVLLAVIDKDGVEWQLRKTGNKKPPYQLYRNRAKLSGILGVGLRKSAEGYMELLQVNGTWIRREGTSWVTVT